MKRMLAFAYIGLALTACGDSAGSFGPDSSSGTTEILIGRTGGISASVVSSLAGGAPPVDFAQVGSLELVINRVEAHRVGGGGWIAFDLLDPIAIDLAGLPDGTVEPVASGGLPEGTYNNVRFFLESATVSFLSDVSVGPSTFSAAQIYDLEIPSVENTGLQVSTAHFTVDAGAEAVVVLFDPAGSTPSIGATGNGKVRMTPVFREADEATEAAEEDETEASEEQGAGDASLYITPVSGASASITAAAGDLALSMLPPSKGPTATDVTSLRLVLCEIRAVRTGGDEEDAEAETESTSETTGGEETTAEEGATADDVGCNGRTAGAGWTTLPLASAEIDLFGLADGEAVQIAAGELPNGRYHNVRLYYSEAWVTFAVDVSVGKDTYLAGTEIALRIPSGENTGIKIPASHFEVGGDGTESMVLLFDKSSAGSLKVTGNAVQMSPVFREAAQSVEDEIVEEEEEGGSSL